MILEALARQVFRTMCLLVLTMHAIYADAWSIVNRGSVPADHPICVTETSSRSMVLSMPFRNDSNDKVRSCRRCSMRLHESSSDSTGTEENCARPCNVKLSELNDMDVVVYSLIQDESQKLCLGALQEDGMLSPLSAWTDEPAFGESIEFLVDEVDRFALQQQTKDQREADGLDTDGNSDDSNKTIRIHHLLSEEEVSYGARQCPRGVHNPHGEESELLYYIDQQVIDQFDVGIELKPELETLW